MTGTLFVEKSYSDQLTGMCGNCDNQDNGYHLADGTSVDDEEDMQVCRGHSRKETIIICRSDEVERLG